MVHAALLARLRNLIELGPTRSSRVWRHVQLPVQDPHGQGTRAVVDAHRHVDAAGKSATAKYEASRRTTRLHSRDCA